MAHPFVSFMHSSSSPFVSVSLTGSLFLSHGAAPRRAKAVRAPVAPTAPSSTAPTIWASMGRAVTGATYFGASMWMCLLVLRACNHSTAYSTCSPTA